MNDFLKYLRAQLLRTAKLYPAIIAFTLALVVGVSLIIFSLFGSRSAREENTRIRVGIVGDLENSYLDIGVAALQSLDTSRFYIEFVELEESEAKAQLSNGELKGYVYIPEGFVDSVADGGDMKLTYVMGNSPAVLSSLLMQEIIDVIGSVVVESQCAVYGYVDLLYKTELTRKVRSQLIDKLTIEYVDKILTREQWYDVQTLGFSGGLSFETYYLCAGLTLMFMLWGTVCVNLLTKRDLALQRVMFSKRRGTVSQIAAEYIPFLGVFVLNIILLFAAASIIFAGREMPLFLPQVAGRLGLLRMGLMLIPAAMLISAMQFMLYELTSSVVSAVLLQILSLVALSYASGLLYPIYSLPAVLQRTAAFLPTGVAFRYISEVVTADVAVGSLVATALYSVAFLSLSAAVRRIKIRGSRI